MSGKSPENLRNDESGTAELRHLAIIMDGNGRWARKRLMPRYAGHRAGVNAVRKIVEDCRERGVGALTLFAFSSENWRRPKKEVGTLMNLFLTALGDEANKLHENDVRLQVIGDRTAFDQNLIKQIEEVESLTVDNTGLRLVIAANYGGRWDISQACRTLAEQVEAGELRASEITEQHFNNACCLSDLPEPDLFIRTGGEQRISNFLLWQLAYTELYFTPVLWPDFTVSHLEEAIEAYTSRQRRFGYTAEQVEQLQNA